MKGKRRMPSVRFRRPAPAPKSSRGAERRAGSHSGFTLVELAIVLVILGVLASSLLAPLGERLERRRHDETQRILQDVRHALLGHLVTQGVLPCPLGGDTLDAVVASVAAAEPVECERGSGGVPAAILGVSGAIDGRGRLLDSWGRALHYAVSLSSYVESGNPDAPDWLVPGEATAVGLQGLSADLSLCTAVVSGSCPGSMTRAHALVFVVLSTGRDAQALDIGRENLDGDRVFAHVPPSIAEGSRFDDLLVWGSRDELAWWLLRAGWFY